MIEIRDLIRVENLEQAYELNQKKTNRIIGGMLWMKMESGRVQNAIDLSGLGLDTIEETEDAYIIGCMTTLRQLELHEGLNTLSQGAFRESVRHIVGVQFRNLATVGGSLFGRFGFSDVLTMFLALDSYVELYKGGIVDMKTFSQMERDNDILVRVIVKKTPVKCVYMSHRNTQTDFPVLACCAAVDEEKCCISVGARPGRAVLMTISHVGYAWTPEEIEAAADQAADTIVTGSNMRAGAAYRTHLVKVLVRRCLTSINA